MQEKDKAAHTPEASKPQNPEVKEESKKSPAQDSSAPSNPEIPEPPPQPEMRPQSAKHGDIKGTSAVAYEQRQVPWEEQEETENQPAPQAISASGKPFQGAMRPITTNPKAFPNPLMVNNYQNPAFQPQAPGPEQRIYPSSAFTSKPQSKHAPKNFLYDKEQLYDEALRLKQNMNSCREENLRLKTRIHQTEKDLDQKDRIIQDLMEQLNGTGASPGTKSGKTVGKNETHLVMALKKQVRDLKAESQAKEEEMGKLKKNLKSTKLQEMEVEVKMFADECTRLKHIIEEVMRQKTSAGYSGADMGEVQERIAQQNLLMKNIKQENGELAEALRKKEEESKNWKDVSVKLESKVGKLEAANKESIKTKKQLQDTKKELQKCKDQIKEMKDAQGDKKSDQGSLQGKIDELLKKQAELKDRVEQKDRLIAEMKKKTTEAESAHDAKEKSKDDEIRKFKGIIQQKEREMVQLKKLLKEKEEIQKESSKKNIEIVKEIPCIKKDEIVSTIKELRFSLISKKINNIAEEIFGATSGNISIKKMTEILSGDPLNLRGDTVKLSRFIIEPKNIENIILNENRESEISEIIKEIKNFVGDRKIKDEEENVQLWERISEKCKEKLANFEHALKENEKTAGIIEYDALDHLGRELDFTQDEKEHLILYMYENSSDFYNLEYKKVLEKISEIISFKEKQQREAEEARREKELKEKEEQERIAQEKADKEKAEQLEKERLAKIAKEKQENLEKEKHDKQEREAQERLEKERKDKKKADKEKENEENKSEPIEEDEVKESLKNEEIVAERAAPPPKPVVEEKKEEPKPGKEQEKQEEMDIVDEVFQEGLLKQEEVVAEKPKEEPEKPEPQPAKAEQKTVPYKPSPQKKEPEPIPEKKPIETKKESEEPEYEAENFESEEPQKEKQRGHSEPQEKAEEGSPLEEQISNIGEDEMIEIAQKCFYTIADKMIQKNQTVGSLFGKKVIKQFANDEEVDVITADDFITALKGLGLDELQNVEYACLIKVLAISDEERLIRVNDLIVILEDYGIQEKPQTAGKSKKGKEGKKEKKRAETPPENEGHAELEAEEAKEEPVAEPEEQEENKEKPSKKDKKGGKEKKEKHQLLNFEALDKVSMVLMLALTEYLIKAKVALFDLFADAIYKQPVKTKTNQKNVDLINSNDFFEVLHKIGIKTEESEHENLKLFLCLDQNYKDKIYVKKLTKAIEEFAFNEELRSYAHQCYQELLEEGEDEENQEEGEKVQKKEGKKEKSSKNKEKRNKNEEENVG